MPWASGVFIPGDKPELDENFGAWRGAAPDVSLTYTGRDTWDNVIDPWWVWDAWRDTEQTIVLSAAMFPEENANLAECARGKYNAKWRKFGRNLVNAGLGNRTIIRLGWEFNGNWVVWAAEKPADYVACWRHIHTSVEIAAPKVRWDWCVNRGVSSALTDARKAYPGDRYVDIVGIDSFDGFPPATTERGWLKQYNGRYGLAFWANFARLHEKRFAVSEWAVYPGTSWGGAGGGDNPLYVARMFRFFRQNADILEYEIYFNEHDPYQGGALHLNPLAAEEYRKQIARTKARACDTCVRPLG
jgi:hypothetical protein